MLGYASVNSYWPSNPEDQLDIYYNHCFKGL